MSLAACKPSPGDRHCTTATGLARFWCPKQGISAHMQTQPCVWKPPPVPVGLSQKVDVIIDVDVVEGPLA
ncbi:hypothetical protein CC2G_001108 [Coprinopsis cinerea AmutBmut pab1-1]|nr:hypothetical protein CC2G_001108 [Coprinopsis cinerea AmutBmut pab1-1]